MRHGFTGRRLVVATACAAGTNAIGEAPAHDPRRLRRRGRGRRDRGRHHADRRWPASPAWGPSRTRNDATASRPFDADRDGFVMGEGAGFAGARAAGPRRGPGRHDPRRAGRLRPHLRRPPHHRPPAGRRGRRGVHAAMALADAGLDPADIGHVNAHGTSTPLNDAAEAAALAEVFGAGGVAGDVDQGRDRPPGGRRRRRRGRVRPPRRPRGPGAAHGQHRCPGPGAADRPRGRRSPRGARRRRRCRTRSGSAATTPPWWSSRSERRRDDPPRADGRRPHRLPGRSPGRSPGRRLPG